VFASTDLMLQNRYTILVADRTTGAVRRLTVSVRTALALLGAVALGLALLLIGARNEASLELATLRIENSSLRQENDSFRAATGELTAQIASLQGVMADIGEKSSLDEETLTAINKLPAMVKNRAMGGSPQRQDAARTLLSMMNAPDSPFGVLRSLLDSLESRLQVVQNDAQRVDALARATPSIWPAVGWLTDGFGTRKDPFHGGSAFHNGLDIAADKGAPVYAAASGVVQSAGWGGDYGNLVVIGHEFGLVTRYAHMSRVDVKAGDRIERGQLVGYIGATGRASGPHLHYEVWANGQPLNPLKFLTTPQRR
jgi:murein DD-endopeptidase MepM/ murein hydrolase activator NlpD